ncbi:MAG: hypothetical protein KZQ91_20665 [Candidatus Thiodiazotropha sp. (ex Lucinoma borealis)]|nr:hypothetical protein [Candidatus Thiodiazotropha sp. (ex Lucinoma borealis)]
MFKKCVYLVTAIVFISISSNSHAIERAFEKYAHIYHEKLMSGNFDELEIDAKNARESKSMISDGQPLLAAIYGGVSGCEFQSCNFPKTLSEWIEKEKKLESWLEEKPDSVTAQVAYASFFIELGWFHHGGGYSNSVSKESWGLFHTNIEKSRGLLLALPEKAKKDAGWLYSMSSIALHQGWPEIEFNKIFSEAISIHPTYIPTYFIKSAYMEPKWYGSHDKFNQYVEEVVALTKPFLGNQMYARLHWSSSGSKLFRSGRTDWEKMKLGFEELVAKHPDKWNLNNYAKFSCLAGDVNKLKKLVHLIDGKPLKSAWFNSLEFYNRCEAFSKRS